MNLLNVQLCETALSRYGKARYFMNGRRIARLAFRDIKNAASLDTFQTTFIRGRRRGFCCAHISPAVFRSILTFKY